MIKRFMYFVGVLLAFMFVFSCAFKQPKESVDNKKTDTTIVVKHSFVYSLFYDNKKNLAIVYKDTLQDYQMQLPKGFEAIDLAVADGKPYLLVCDKKSGESKIYCADSLVFSLEKKYRVSSIDAYNKDIYALATLSENNQKTVVVLKNNSVVDSISTADFDAGLVCVKDGDVWTSINNTNYSKLFVNGQLLRQYDKGLINQILPLKSNNVVVLICSSVGNDNLYTMYYNATLSFVSESLDYSGNSYFVEPRYACSVGDSVYFSTCDKLDELSVTSLWKGHLRLATFSGNPKQLSGAAAFIASCCGMTSANSKVYRILREDDMEHTFASFFFCEDVDNFTELVGLDNNVECLRVVAEK